MRVGLQRMSQSRSLHKDIRLQVQQQEVPLPCIEGLIFINIPRCQGAGLPKAAGRGRGPGPVQPALLPVHPSLSAQLGLGG